MTTVGCWGCCEWVLLADDFWFDEVLGAGAALHVFTRFIPCFSISIWSTSSSTAWTRWWEWSSPRWSASSGWSASWTLRLMKINLPWSWHYYKLEKREKYGFFPVRVKSGPLMS